MELNLRSSRGAAGKHGRISSRPFPARILLLLALGFSSGSAHVPADSSPGTRPELVLQTGHSGTIFGMAFSPGVSSWIAWIR